MSTTLLVLGDYPWRVVASVIRTDGRAEYLSDFDHASIESDVRSFAGFIAGQVRWVMGDKSIAN